MDNDNTSFTFNPPAAEYGNSTAEDTGEKSTASSTGPAKQPQKRKVYRLSDGFVRFKPGASSIERKSYWKTREAQEQGNSELKDKTKPPIPDTWEFFNSRLAGKSIQMYASQVLTLIELLPSAYMAFENGDTTFFKVIAENKTQRLSLEIYIYKDKRYLSMRKYFKPEDKADDPNQGWLPTGSNISFHPNQDDPEYLLDFILTTAGTQ